MTMPCSESVEGCGKQTRYKMASGSGRSKEHPVWQRNGGPMWRNGDVYECSWVVDSSSRRARGK